MKRVGDLEKALGDEKLNSKKVKQKLSRAQVKIAKQEKELLEMYRKIEEVRKRKSEEILTGLPDTPRAVLEVMLHGGKKIQWKKHPATLELCLRIFFRSPSAYKQLRAAGFVLPHPRTLRNRFSGILKTPGFCSELEKMITLRAKGLAEHEKLVTLSLDGMKLSPHFRYSKHSDTISGFEDLGSKGRTN